MFAWYAGAEVCYALLTDIEPVMAIGDDGQLVPAPPANFQSSRWFSRGWTLQELLAPAKVLFFVHGWIAIGSLEELAPTVASTSGIPLEILQHQKRLSECTVAQRLSWASHRDTTRPEDSAYALLGILDISLDLRYGEGQRAFVRLQEEVLLRTGDLSILAWERPALSGATDLFAKSPSAFDACCNIVANGEDPSLSEHWMTSNGLRGTFTVLEGSDGDDLESALISLHCHDKTASRETLALRVEVAGRAAGRAETTFCIHSSPSRRRLGAIKGSSTHTMRRMQVTVQRMQRLPKLSRHASSPTGRSREPVVLGAGHVRRHPDMRQQNSRGPGRTRERTAAAIVEEADYGSDMQQDYAKLRRAESKADGFTPRPQPVIIREETPSIIREGPPQPIIIREVPPQSQPIFIRQRPHSITHADLGSTKAHVSSEDLLNGRTGRPTGHRYRSSNGEIITESSDAARRRRRASRVYQERRPSPPEGRSMSRQVDRERRRSPPERHYVNRTDLSVLGANWRKSFGPTGIPRSPSPARSRVAEGQNGARSYIHSDARINRERDSSTGANYSSSDSYDGLNDDDELRGAQQRRRDRRDDRESVRRYSVPHQSGMDVHSFVNETERSPSPVRRETHRSIGRSEPYTAVRRYQVPTR